MEIYFNRIYKMLGFIYIIRSQHTDDVYYGSTTKDLTKRLLQHRYDYKKWLNKTTNYTSSFSIIKYDDAYIELVEEVNFENKKELCNIEGRYIRENKCINKCIIGRTHQEWLEVNKEQQKLYREEHKDKIAEYGKKWKEENRDKVNEAQRIRRVKKKSNQSTIL
jgi:predicted GIY-YIG superfamily endonuclease